MKGLFSLFILILYVTSITAQEINLNSKFVATAGVNSGKQSVNITKWKLGETHTLLLNSSAIEEMEKSNWGVKSFPNPFTNILHVQIQTKGKRDIRIQLTDIQGKNIYFKNNETIFGSQVLQFNLSNLKPAIYLLQVSSNDNSEIKIQKIQKN